MLIPAPSLDELDTKRSHFSINNPNNKENLSNSKPPGILTNDSALMTFGQNGDKDTNQFAIINEIPERCAHSPAPPLPQDVVRSIDHHKTEPVKRSNFTEDEGHNNLKVHTRNSGHRFTDRLSEIKYSKVYEKWTNL